MILVVSIRENLEVSNKLELIETRKYIYILYLTRKENYNLETLIFFKK